MSSFRPRHPALLLGAAAALAIVVIVVLVVTLGDGDGTDDDRPDYLYPVQTFEDLGRDHLAAGQSYDGYNSTPPTSGPHAPQPADWGIYDVAVPKEVIPHNLEHGGVMIAYDCSAGDAPLDEAACDELRESLTTVTQEARADDKFVLTSPYPGLEGRIALLAWTTMDTLDEFDGARIRAFIESFERKFNPEGF